MLKPLYTIYSFTTGSGYENEWELAIIITFSFVLFNVVFNAVLFILWQSQAADFGKPSVKFRVPMCDTHILHINLIRKNVFYLIIKAGRFMGSKIIRTARAVINLLITACYKAKLISSHFHWRQIDQRPSVRTVLKLNK